MSAGFSIQSADGGSKKKKFPSQEIVITWSECRIAEADAEPIPVSFQISDTTENPFYLSSEVADKVKEAHSHLQQVKQDTEKGFVQKCKVIADRLDFVIRAVDPIAEVCSLDFSFRFTHPFPRSILMPKSLGV